MVDLRDPVQWPAQVAVAAGVLKESERGLGHGQRVADLQPYGGRIGHRPGGPAPAHLGPLIGELHAVRAGEPHPGSSGLRQGDPVGQPRLPQSGQPSPGLLDAHPGGDHPVHLFGRGHPVLNQHRQRQPVTPAHVHVRHHGFARFLSGTAPLWRRAYRTGQQPAPTRDPTIKARPRSRCDNASVDQAGIPADNPADNRPHPLTHIPANPQLTMPARPWSGWPTSPLRPRVHPPPQQEEKEKWVGGTGPGGGRGDRAPPVLLARRRGRARHRAEQR